MKNIAYKFILVTIVSLSSVAYAGNGWGAGLFGGAIGFMAGNAVANSRRPSTVVVEENHYHTGNRYKNKRQLREAEEYIAELEQQISIGQKQLAAANAKINELEEAMARTTASITA